MKKIKKFSKLNKKRLFICFLVATIMAIPVITVADDSWTGWTDKKKEEAMAVYSMTDWKDIEGIYFTEDGSCASAVVDKKFREKYEELVENVLKDSDNGLYQSQEYKELMLAIIYVLNDWKAFDDNDTDICLYNKFISNSVSVTSQKQSVELLYSRLLECERAYSKASSEPAKLFSANNQLGSVIQGIVYGPEYTSKYINYTKENAEKFYDKHGDKISNDYGKQMNKFAKKVLSIYNAVETGGHTVVG